MENFELTKSNNEDLLISDVAKKAVDLDEYELISEGL